MTPELVVGFRAYWHVLVTEGTWQERVANPFRFLLQEQFWKLIKDGQEVQGRTIGDTPSIKLLNEHVDYAQFDAELRLLLQDKSALQTLRTPLLQVHFGTEPAKFVKIKATVTSFAMFCFRASSSLSTTMPVPWMRFVLCLLEFSTMTTRVMATLCKDHHWAFDVGGIAVDQNCSIVLSIRLTASVTFVIPATSLLLPSNLTYAPAQEALDWHRANKFLK